MDIGFIVIHAMWSACSALLVGLWQEFGETRIPPLEWIPIDQEEPELKRSKRSVQQRLWFLSSCAMLGFFVGALISFYIKGFMIETPPNEYAIMFYILLGGFLMPNILLFLNKLKISKYAGKVLGKI
ncbi:hypothetical protein [Alkalimarinus coralli]|uniref:hypothetical protein n=1 Tax=Alkalimarinus coralli TaxID=2935863 RepID=UPI00202B42C6|nr:hypothetical protein [Alkalimarinus coralli]